MEKDIKTLLTECGNYSYCAKCNHDTASKCATEDIKALGRVKKKFCKGCAKYNICVFNREQFKKMYFGEVSCYTPEIKFNARNFYLRPGIRINMPRGWGKTKIAMYLSERLQYPILVSTIIERENIIDAAINMCLDIPTPLLISTLDGYEGKLIVDNIECFDEEVISQYKDRIYACTTTEGDMKEITNVLYNY